jgi:hypothetical protein
MRVEIKRREKVRDSRTAKDKRDKRVIKVRNGGESICEAVSPTADYWLYVTGCWGSE